MLIYYRRRSEYNYSIQLIKQLRKQIPSIENDVIKLVNTVLQIVISKPDKKND